MKSQIAKLTAFFLMVSFLFAACRKDEVFQKPIPGTGDTETPGKPTDTGSFRFATTVDLTGHPYHSSNLMAVVSIVNEKKDTVVNEKTLTLDLNGTVKTLNLQLPAGNYKLTKFRLVYGSVNTHFAAPISGSAKAALVQKPLALAFTISKGTNDDVPVEAIRVQNGEQPSAFGYPSSAFDNGQTDASSFLKVKITALMQVGKINYDTVPASLALYTWDNNGERSVAFISLKAGINEVPVLKSGSRFQLDISKWGITESILIDRKDVSEDTVYTFRGVKEAKRLKLEVTYKLVEGIYKAQSKNEYSYDAKGNLSQIKYYLKREDNTPYLAMFDVFEYNGTSVQKISRYNENNKLTGVTSFTYDHLGRVRSMAQEENGNRTVATVTYTNYTHPGIHIHYTYPDQSYSQDYTMTFYKGNLTDGSVSISGESRETGRYNYDDGINPYAHMNWPNLFLSNSSKNNVTAEYKTYYVNPPDALPYNFSYSYDGDGYPTQLVKMFHSYSDNNYMYTTKTVYTY